MRNLSFLYLSLNLLFIFFICGCNSEPKEQKDEQEVLEIEPEVEIDKLGETFYQIPSPEELFAFVEDGKLTYKPSLTNPIDNISKYSDVKSKEFNFGVYIADLAYAAAFSKYQESLKNIETVRELSEEIGISSVFDEALNNRIRDIFENPDSLLNITNSSYYKIVSYLEENERGKTLAIIAAGGWLESLYIFTNLIDNYTDKNPTIQRIADQKLTFENLILYLKKHEADTNVKEIINDFTAVRDAFAQLEVVKSNTSDTQNNKSNVIVVGGGKRINITEEQFMNIKEKIKTTRNKLTAN